MRRPRNQTLVTESAPEVIPFKDCPAKTIGSKPDIRKGRTVPDHCLIVGNVAREIISRQPEHISQKLYPKGAAFTAATHDIGKVSPTFYNKIMKACSAEDGIPGFNPDCEKQWGGHAGVSQLTAKEMDAPKLIPEILGQHHGFSPQVGGKRATGEIFGSQAWQSEREKLVHFLQNQLCESWPTVSSDPQARLLAGLTSVSDWIGSGEYFEEPSEAWEGNIKKAVDDAGFVLPSYVEGLSFEDIFTFSPYSTQSALIEQVTSPGVYILEAPMGEGKTEAALFSAYQMLSAVQAMGIYFALPTQLTSDKIFDRFNDFLGKILAKECKHRAFLLHAKALLRNSEMGEEGRPGGSWFNQRKRGLLAPFAVGTIDQALMAAMNVKHGFVRAFGLAGKVVILDEVHAYDTYTGSLLCELVALLRQLHCTVIILSATLDTARRQNLIGSDQKLIVEEYPSVTISNKETPLREIALAAVSNKSIAIRLFNDKKLGIEEALERAQIGQQVLWIENTVKEAQDCYLDLAARAKDLGISCGLLHSRFTIHRREEMENEWIDLLGKKGRQQRQKQGRILIGTQVLEQSLDIDADFLVARFAPTDMILQRLGRLWRHTDYDETQRGKNAKREAWLLAPKLDGAIENPSEAFGKSALVYGAYVLCRSLEVWESKTSVQIPDDIRALIRDTYSERDETQERMQQWLDELNNGAKYRKGKNALLSLARIALARGGKTLPESKAQTRYTETESVEVLLLKSIHRDEDKNVAKLTLLTGDEVSLPLRHNALSKQEWREHSVKLMKQVVTVPEYCAPKSLPIERLREYSLQYCFWLVYNSDYLDDESALRVALVSDEGWLYSMQGIGISVHDKYTIEYCNRLGYRYKKVNSK